MIRNIASVCWLDDNRDAVCSNFVACINFTIIVIVISKLLKRHSKAKRRAPAYSRALRQIMIIIRRLLLHKGTIESTEKNTFCELRNQ